MKHYVRRIPLWRLQRNPSPEQLKAFLELEGSVVGFALHKPRDVAQRMLKDMEEMEELPGALRRFHLLYDADEEICIKNICNLYLERKITTDE